jgi:glycosyltransferase involved in cell wall biosynthesis
MLTKAIWLASWYPNKHNPAIGDFIQRHAISVAQQIQVDVIHVAQAGSNTYVPENKIDITSNGNLNEYIYYFRFKPLGITLIDKIRYNLLYKKKYITILKQYIAKNGKPAFFHVHVAMKAGIVANFFLKKNKIRYILSEHSSVYENAPLDNFYNRSLYFKINTRKIFNNASLITNVSKTLGENMKTMFGIKEVFTIHNVVNTSSFFYLPVSKSSIFKWLHVSSLQVQKNPYGILNAFFKLDKLNKNWQLTICGHADSSLINYADNLGLLDKIIFTGEIAYTAVAKYMQQADAFVLFSEHENFPCVIVEALCCGLPVISTNVGGVGEAVNKTNGLLIQEGDINLLVNALQQMMETYQQYNRQQIADAASQKYNMQTIASQFMDMYSVLKL